MIYKEKEYAFVTEHQGATYWRCVSEPNLEIKIYGDEILTCIIKEEI